MLPLPDEEHKYLQIYFDRSISRRFSGDVPYQQPLGIYMFKQAKYLLQNHSDDQKIAIHGDKQRLDNIQDDSMRPQ